MRLLCVHCRTPIYPVAAEATVVLCVQCGTIMIHQDAVLRKPTHEQMRRPDVQFLITLTEGEKLNHWRKAVMAGNN